MIIILILFYQQLRLSNLVTPFLDLHFLLKKKINNQIKNIFIHDTGNNLKNLSPDSNTTSNNTVIAKSGIIEDKKILLINGQIISSKENDESQIIDFEQLLINLNNLDTTTIKKPKVQETSTLDLIYCLVGEEKNLKLCNKDFKKRDNFNT